MLSRAEKDELRKLVREYWDAGHVQMWTHLDPSKTEADREAATEANGDAAWRIDAWTDEHTEPMQPDAALAGHGVQGRKS